MPGFGLSFRLVAGEPADSCKASQRLESARQASYSFAQEEGDSAEEALNYG